MTLWCLVPNQRPGVRKPATAWTWGQSVATRPPGARVKGNRCWVAAWRWGSVLPLGRVLPYPSWLPAARPGSAVPDVRVSAITSKALG
jgi:hypothetical protein